uniref:RING-type E3 ubiquitin transferase n=1 Tax=Mantoniella antarctica TaxID=81844 RepID=A0A7S0SM51_9CHLO|mmetsp:Transcript_30469/g.76288  ORF Transcript_30469/g.76288 Transcript_30469/m.76288 type:complete len:386 (+) Transcript_30469:190-1347(+)|eukprot:CAMPEP_0181371026 /NCGR_PEP_ID=MMETSP1106-20121128/13799_1 /TAXON_ID=81844 /ORGANISM="Mantoniella antarctica, Strain SL-175" /LENGTH=385 /DNA_ID=CAMNT_0023487977 /DNA_START=190 /DNA_END=1347 /DNA_ORIENTATION=+
MGTGYSRSSPGARAGARRPVNAAGGGTTYPSPPTPQQSYGRPPANNGQLYGGFQQAQQYMFPQQYGLQGQPGQQPPPPPQPQATEQTTRATTIRNHVNLKKNTLTVVPVDPTKPDKLTVAFTFDANIPCWASVFLVASENAKEGCRITQSRAGRAAPRRTEHAQGLGQSFESAAEAALDVSGFSVEELTASTANTFPIIIRLECISGEEEEGSLPRALPEPVGASLLPWVQSQTTYATLLKKEDGSFSIQVVKQKIWVEGVSYELQEIFGIENCSTGMPLDEDSSGKECVVCLSEARDTTVLPCRHMCMCSGCARMLRHQSNRCPICRTPVESLLEIKVAAKAPETSAEPTAAAAARAGRSGSGSDSRRQSTDAGSVNISVGAAN